MFRKVVLLAMMVLCLTGCGVQENVGNEKEPAILTLAMFEKNSQLREQVALFNQNNTEYQIEIVEYQRSEILEEDGRAKMQREIISGKGPDIIDFGSTYASSDIVGGYTENLLPYLEQEAGEDDYFWNILDAFSYKDGLYVLPCSFSLYTFVGSKEALGERTHWNVSEMMACYEEVAGEMKLYPDETKKEVFTSIMYGSMDCYIDWETGTCSFDGEEFRKVMLFANTFPDVMDIPEGYTPLDLHLEKKALLDNRYLMNMYDICTAEYLFGEETYIGLPVEGNSGTIINPKGPVLAISVSCKEKDVAWDFIYQCLSKEYQKALTEGFPVSRTAFLELLEENSKIQYVLDDEGNSVPLAKDAIRFAGEEPIDLYYISQEQADKILDLIEGAQMCTAIDYQLYYPLLEEAYSYFAGDKTLDEALAVMQSRASIFVSERVELDGN